MALPESGEFIVRTQNRGRSSDLDFESWQTGDTAGVVIDPGAVQILRD
ncbi:MAG: hypothetical protein GKR96_03355 [Gammaproteobacteria bacterium]|nr:hypothetical protein [Gammaproteobacteria bacterium]